MESMSSWFVDWSTLMLAGIPEDGVHVFFGLWIGVDWCCQESLSMASM